VIKLKTAVTSVKAAGDLNKYHKDFGQTENA